MYDGLQPFLIGLCYRGLRTFVTNPRYLKYHRMNGRVALVASALASLLAWRVSPYALYGTQIVYIPWNALWCVATYKTYAHARAKEFAAHRLWANVLVQTAFLFVTSRVFIIIGLALGIPPKVCCCNCVFGSASDLGNLVLLPPPPPCPTNALCNEHTSGLSEAAFRITVTIHSLRRQNRTFVCTELRTGQQQDK